MVATATNIKTPALPAQIDVNGASIATPTGASGIVGKLSGQDLYVVRNGQTLSLRAGDWLMDGDRVVTGSAAEQVLYFAGDMPNTLNKVIFGRGADFRIKNGEVYTTSMITMSLVAARDGLANEPASVVGMDDTLNTNDEAVASEEALAAEAGSGLFGSGLLAGGAGATLGIGGAALAVLGLANNDSGSEASTPTPPQNDQPNDQGADQDPPAEEPSGNFGSGAMQLTEVLPLEQGGDMGANFEAMLLDWAAMLDSAAPAGQSGGLPASPDQLINTLTDTLQGILSPISAVIPGGSSSLPIPLPPGV